MGRIVGAFVMPHDPLVFVNPRGMDQAHLLAAYSEIRERVSRLQADTAIIVGADHYILFGPRCLPQILIGTGDISGPIDRLPGLPCAEFVNDEDLAERIFEVGQEEGFDLAVARTLAFDHSVGIPAHLCTTPGMKIIPVYIASGVAPFIRPSRAFALGQMIRHAVERDEDDRRVVVFGSGGISHWVGTRDMGRVNEDFDRMVLDAVVTGKARALIDLDDQEVRRTAGNGAMEIRQFLVAMGAWSGGGGEVIAYEAWPGGVAGLGFASVGGAES